MSLHTGINLDARRKLLVTGIPTDKVIERAKEEFHVQFWHKDEPIGERIVQEANGFDALLIMPDDRLDASIINRLPHSVEVLATHSVGFDHIDLAAANARRMPVYNTPDVLTEAVADLAMFLILAGVRKTTSAEATLRQGEWVRWTPTGFLGRSMSGLRLAVFGMGRIGQAVAQRAASFGMQLHYHNRRRLPEEREQGALFHDTVESLLRVSDVFCICAPSSADLNGVINAERLLLMPQGAIVVNIARGNLVDENALFSAVREGLIGAVATDVFCNEPHINPQWQSLPNVTLLPHIGSATQEARTAMGMLALDGIHSHFRKAPAANLLNPEVFDQARGGNN